MKVELQCGDTIAIPDGCKAIVKDGNVIFEKEKQEFKDGDVLHSVYNSTMLIFKEEEKDHSNRFYTHYNTNHSSNEKWNKDAFRHATEEEKQLLFDKMKEQGLKWNPKEKRVEKIRWRASLDERYYYINHLLDCVSDIEESHIFDEERWELGNYFQTEEETEEAAKILREALCKFRKENE
jgi:hypothetical protein